jgi:hypothetical protein
MKKSLSIIKKNPIFILFLIVILLISSFFNLINTSLEGNDFQLNLGIFDYQGLSAAAEWFTLLGALVIYIFYTRQQDKLQEEQRMAERRSMKWQSTEVLRWAMDELSPTKKRLFIVFKTFKHEMDSILITSYKFPVSEEDKCNRKPITDDERISYIRELSINEKERFYQEVKNINILHISGGDHAESVLHLNLELQKIVYLCMFDFVPKQHFINLWGPVILAAWYSMEGYIRHERMRMGECAEDNDYSPEDYIKMFDSSEDGMTPKHYQGPQFRVHLELLAKQMEEGLVPLQLVNRERERFGRPRLEG